MTHFDFPAVLLALAIVFGFAASVALWVVANVAVVGSVLDHHHTTLGAIAIIAGAVGVNAVVVAIVAFALEGEL